MDVNLQGSLALQAQQSAEANSAVRRDLAAPQGRGAVISTAVANRLGITRLDADPAVFVGNDAYTVVGTFTFTDRVPGLALGVVIAVSLAQHWTAVIDLRLVYPTPFAGALIGAPAGACPAWRAARVEPVVALRR